MTLTIDGKVVTDIHPVVQAMVELLVEKQAGVWKRHVGRVELYFGPAEVTMKVFDGPVFTGMRKTRDKPCP